MVIGGSSGIGLETARRARAEGADIILAARNRDRLEQGNSALMGELNLTRKPVAARDLTTRDARGHRSPASPIGGI